MSTTHRKQHTDMFRMNNVLICATYYSGKKSLKEKNAVKLLYILIIKKNKTWQGNKTGRKRLESQGFYFFIDNTYY